MLACRFPGRLPQFEAMPSPLQDGIRPLFPGPSSPSRLGEGQTAAEASEVELGSVRLINARDFAENGYSDRGPFHDVPLHHRPEPILSRVRERLQDWYERWRASPLLFWSSIGGLVTLVLLVVLAVQWGSDSALPLIKNSCPTAGSFAGDTAAPEGSIRSSFEAQYDYRGRPRRVVAQQGVVAADHSRCSDIGLEVLKDGGNAVDAAIATCLCQGVMNPMASGLGGGHFMLIRLPNGTAEVIDAREVAPAAANETMFAASPRLSLVGGLAAGVPLELRGLALAHSRHGSLPWERLVEPSISPAERGFPAHPYLVAALKAQNWTSWITDHPGLRDTFLMLDTKGWRLPSVNESCCARPSLAALLRDVSQSPDALYTGKYAAGLAAEISAAGGVITAQDLAAARPVVRQPLRARAFGVDIVTAPPPSSGAAVLAALMVLSGYELPLAGSESLGVHRLVEAMKHAFAMRAHLGDPGPPPLPPLVPANTSRNSSSSSSGGGSSGSGASGSSGSGSGSGSGGNSSSADDLARNAYAYFYGNGSGLPFVEVAGVLRDMLSPGFAETLRSLVNDSATLNATAYGGRWGIAQAGIPPEDHGTSHISVVDSSRMAVSLTTTINGGFGAKLFSKSTGIVLNNQMDDFSTPNRSNGYSLPPSPANFVRPGKRPLSSMSPLVVEAGGELRAVLGGSGGPRIISGVLQALVRLLAYGQDPFSAVSNPRLHSQLVPNQLYAEDWGASGGQLAFTYNEATRQALAQRGHNVTGTDWGAVVQAVVVGRDDGRLVGVSDPRKDGAPAGY